MSIDLSLSRLSSLLPKLPYTRPTIHIAGTNGKGSVSALIASIFIHTKRNPPLKVGRFNSPHLVHITDCILINDEPVDDATYLSTRDSVLQIDLDVNGEDNRLTSFELLTLTALRIFETSLVDVAVIEVGMGGATDATNIIPSECILASVLTQVDLDHQAFLGNCLEEIAQTKAGIARMGKPFVLGTQRGELGEGRREVEEAVKGVVQSVGAVLKGSVEVKERKDQRERNSKTGFNPPSATPVEFTIPTLSPDPIRTTLPLHGAHQLRNLGTALGVIQALLSPSSSPSSSTPPRQSLDLHSLLTVKAIQEGVKNVRWRGRLSWHTYLGTPVLVDGAHNPASSQALRDYLQEISPESGEARITYVLALSHSPPKQPRDTLGPLLKPYAGNVKVDVAFVPFTPPSGMPWVKYVPPSTLAGVAREILLPSLPSSSPSSPPSSLPSSPPSSSESSESNADTIWVPREGEEVGELLEEGKENRWLREALDWAVSRGEGKEHHLVVVAGSLYLVADFYRLNEGGVGL
ncbi:hypothetical protein NMY22_g14044 [Coprinellus aureogranulatus]|nr:hypothetical protein NMY22_g14044 [Coprinellus aureogranulatus]